MLQLDSIKAAGLKINTDLVVKKHNCSLTKNNTQTAVMNITDKRIVRKK